MKSNQIEVRATIALPGLAFNSVAMVDPANEYIRMCLDSEKLVPTEGVWPPEAEEEPAEAS